MKTYTMIVLIALLAAEAWAAIDTYVADMAREPERYAGRVVAIRGRVVPTDPGRGRAAGNVYTLEDDFGDRVEVTTDQLPAIGLTVNVTGYVNRDATGGLSLYERSRAREKAPSAGALVPKEYVIAAAAVFVVLLLVLVRARTPRQLAPASPFSRSVSAPRASSAAPFARSSGPDLAAAPSSRGAPTMRLDAIMRHFTSGALDGLRASLTVLDGPSGVGDAQAIAKRECTIGRSGDIRLPADHLTVSNEHAKTTYDGAGEFRLTHVSHTNTTMVNGERVTADRRLESGDVLQLGATQLRFDVRSNEVSG